MVAIVQYCRSSLLSHCVSAVLARDTDLRLLRTVYKSSELLPIASSQRPQVVLLASINDEFVGLVDIKEMRSLLPNARILVLSVVGEERFGVYCLRAGASGFVGKNATDIELFEAIHRVARGLHYIPATVAELMFEGMGARDPNRQADELSAREFQVLSGIRLGKTFKEISAYLGISPKTVGTYRTRLLKKLHLETNADLILYGARVDMQPGASRLVAASGRPAHRNTGTALVSAGQC
jgi:two-component system, NarL family, invasion response regulator UvrY